MTSSARPAAAAPLLLILACHAGLGLAGVSWHAYRRLGAASDGAPLTIYNSAARESLADCVVACALIACVKFSFQPASKLCLTSGLVNAKMGLDDSWLDVSKETLTSSFCPGLAQVKGRNFCVFQQRFNASGRFDRPWSDYAVGFGNPWNWWIGLSLLSSLTGPRGRTLRVELVLRSGKLHYFEYSNFSVSDASAKFAMTYGQFQAADSTVANDSLAQHWGMQFSTVDSDNDLMASGSCANASGGAGWWFGNCYTCNPNGVYMSPPLPAATSTVPAASPRTSGTSYSGTTTSYSMNGTSYSLSTSASTIDSASTSPSAITSTSTSTIDSASTSTIASTSTSTSTIASTSTSSWIMWYAASDVEPATYLRMMLQI